MYRTVRECDVCGRRFRIKCANQLRCSEKCKKSGERKKAAEYNAAYRAKKGSRERYNERRREWRRRNRDREREKARRYVADNRERVAKRSAEYQVKRRLTRQVIKSPYISEGTLKDYLHAYYEANREKLQARNKQWRKLNPERAAENDRRWRQANKQRINARLSKRLKQEPVLRLVVYVRNRIAKALRLARSFKTSATHRYVGMSGPELMSYLLAHHNSHSQFTSDNYGTVWHCDHILPLASFDLADPAQAAKAFHYTNLQPLRAKDNLSKGSLLGGQRHRYIKSTAKPHRK
jgi:hypothetical protein